MKFTHYIFLKGINKKLGIFWSGNYMVSYLHLPFLNIGMH